MQTALKLLPPQKIVLLNAIPDIDCCEEIILDGQVIGLHRYRIDTLSWEFIPKIEGARRLVELTPAKQVVIEESAVKFIVGGANLLRPGIKTADASIKEGDYVIGVTEQGKAILVGIATMAGVNMQTRERGMAVKKRYKAQPLEPQILASGQTMEQVLEANSTLLKRIEDEAISFIQQTSEKTNLPIVVAFSGGKDSLAVLLLTKKALTEKPFAVMFVNTGIEFPETIENVYSTTAKFGVDNQLIVKEVSKEQFFQVLQLYGLVARDYRVCCKTVKLGPTTQLIEEHFPSGCLSFIGQLYEAGFERIGCMFCPASNMNEFKIIASRYPTEWKEWQNIVTQIAEQQGMDQRWIKHGFWRWKVPPPKIHELAERMGINLSPSDSSTSNESTPFEYSVRNRGDASELVVEGRFHVSIDLDRAATFLFVLGDVVLDGERDMLEISFAGENSSGHGFLFGNGQFTLSGMSELQTAELFVRTVLRGLLCTACGTCLALCKNDAIILEEDKVRINTEKCVRCQACLSGKCPSLYVIG